MFLIYIILFKYEEIKDIRFILRKYYKLNSCNFLNMVCKYNVLFKNRVYEGDRLGNCR